MKQEFMVSMAAAARSGKSGSGNVRSGTSRDRAGWRANGRRQD